MTNPHVTEAEETKASTERLTGMTHTFQHPVAVYSGTELITVIDAPSAKDAWDIARATVRAHAYHEECSGGFKRGVSGWDVDLRLYLSGAYWCAALEAS